MTNNKEKFILALIIIIAAASVVLRLLPHMPNFAPIGALALFVGLYSTKKWWLLIPLAAMFVSDIFIGFYDWRVMSAVYLGFVVYAAIGRVVKNNKSVFTIVGGTFAGALLFYITTNFAVWAFSGMYPHTPQGLILSYEMALPFFRNTLMGDLFYVGTFVGTYELAIKIFPRFNRSAFYSKALSPIVTDRSR